MLTSWFKFNADEKKKYEAKLTEGTHGQTVPKPAALSTCYADIGSIASWVKKECRWKCRRTRTQCVGRLPFVHPSDKERWCLKQLLCALPWATSWDETLNRPHQHEWHANGHEQSTTTMDSRTLSLQTNDIWTLIVILWIQTKSRTDQNKLVATKDKVKEGPKVHQHSYKLHCTVLTCQALNIAPRSVNCYLWWCGWPMPDVLIGTTNIWNLYFHNFKINPIFSTIYSAVFMLPIEIVK